MQQDNGDGFTVEKSPEGAQVSHHDVEQEAAKAVDEANADLEREREARMKAREDQINKDQ